MKCEQMLMGGGKRDLIIDSIKGFTIILVILGHLPVSSNFRHYIYSFHMPLFIFLSGYFFTQKPIKESISKSSKKLLMPFVIYSIIASLFYLSIGDTSLSIHRISAILFPCGIYNEYPFQSIYVNCIGPIWFLPVLFLTKEIYNTIRLHISDNNIFYFVIVSISIASYFASKYIELPFSLLTACTSMIFYLMGNFYRIANLKQNIYGCILSVLIWMVCIRYSSIEIVLNKYNNYIVAIIGAFCAILFIIYAFSKINNIKAMALLSYIGKDTMFILFAHNIVLRLSQYFLNIDTLLMQIVNFLTPFILLLLYKKRDGFYRLFNHNM